MRTQFLIEQYLAEMERRIPTSSWFRASRSILTYAGGKLPATVGRVKPLHLETVWVDFVEERGLAAATQPVYRRAFQSFWGWCDRHRHTDENIIRRARLRADAFTEESRVHKGRAVVLTHQEISRLLNGWDTCSGEGIAAQIAHGIYATGMRPSEFLALKPEDAQAESLVVRPEVSKTGRGRVVPCPVLVPAFVFSGEMMTSANFSAYLRYMASARLGKHVTPYALRHSHITHAIERGEPLMRIAKRCGTSIAQLSATYYHLIPEAQL